MVRRDLRQLFVAGIGADAVEEVLVLQANEAQFDSLTRRSRVRIPPPLLAKGPRKRALGVPYGGSTEGRRRAADSPDATRAESRVVTRFGHDLDGLAGRV